MREGMKEEINQQISLAGSQGETLSPEQKNPPPPTNSRPKPPPLVHLVAGGLGGMCGSIVTAPFDLVKTRLQSDLYQQQRSKAASSVASAGNAAGKKVAFRGIWWTFKDLGYILRDVYKYEGPTALFKGLGPTLAGVIPGRSINFFVYGNGKVMYADYFNHGEENALVQVTAAATAGVVTAIATNPLWVIKTRRQLQPDNSSYSAILDLLRKEGIRGFYGGLSASLLGVTEGSIQWTLYEQFKILARGKDGQESAGWKMSAAAGGAKLIATIITYPHEVIRTRLRQPPPPGQTALKYTGLVQSFKVVLREEGWRALYGGMSPHLMRVVPNAVTMFYVYEFCLKQFTKKEEDKDKKAALRE